MTLFALSCSLNEEVNIQYNQFFGSDFTHCKSFTVNVTVSVLLSQAMRRNSKSSAVALFALLSALLKLNEGRLLDGYKFPVYTTESCPKSNTEWLERSSSLQCNETNGYMCIPNEEITMLLEFCYHLPKTIIPKGACLILYESSSAVNDYKCRRFSFGCPNLPYFSNEIHKQQSCVSIGNGCFIAEPYCNWTVSTKTITATSRFNTDERAYMFWILGGFTFSGWLLAILSMIYTRFKSVNDTQNKSRYGEKDKELNLEQFNPITPVRGPIPGVEVSTETETVKFIAKI